ncbi:MAG: acetyl-CoA carboxylase carboxyltransferase subunit alpha [Lachnospiraceae bacterium]|nr:acetyl-CoA carboxylase carboxyltransferase subunit alpha [Lachnospiraceae bacterium]
MKLKNMFKKTGGKNYISLTEGRKPEVPEGLLRKCNNCKAAIIAEDVKRGYYICPKCHAYFRMDAWRRIETIADPDSFEVWEEAVLTGNPMGYPGYEEKLQNVREKTGLDEAVVIGRAEIEGRKVVLGVCDGRFLMASMGEAVGEKIAGAVERATKEGLPVILFACSGGARMQEGIFSLMQMAKTAAALKRHSDAGHLYISVLTDPTTGGVTASFAMLGDLILAEPNALIGFAGPRVIEQTIGQKLPKGFQRAEFLLEHGFIDQIVEREKLRETLGTILKLHPGQQDRAAQAGEQEQQNKNQGEKERAEQCRIREMTPWERVQVSRRKDRPVGSDYIRELVDDFVELHGDRLFGDDKAVIGGIGYFCGEPVTVIAQEKGTTTKENIARNFGMPSPEGYRKALRLMKQAEKFHRPVICFVDTPGAFCGLEAEERGQGEAIARNIYEMSALKVPVLSVIIGEGGSGGALALATSDEVWMLENSIYSILSPEGFASILWKDSKRAKEAAEVMKLTAKDLYEAGIVEQVFAEPEEFTSETFARVTENLREHIRSFLNTYQGMEEVERTEKRYQRFRRL